MIEAIKRFFIGHTHKWVTLETHDIKHYHSNNYAKRIIVLKCEVCGTLKNHTISW